MKEAYAALVRDTLRFLQEKWPTPIRQSTEERAKNPPKVEKPEENEWALHSMPQAEEKTLSFSFKQSELKIPVRLFLSEESPEHRLFLENVARAITSHFSPASVALFQEERFRDPHVKYVLAPVSLLKKEFPQVESHQLFKANGILFLPLEELENYNVDLNLKRALWKTLQNMFRS